MTAEQIRAAGQAAVTPGQSLAIALAAVHAACPKAIRELTLDDIDLPSRRITIAGHRQRLGELTRNALLAWLGYRRATWPDTASRPVLLSRISALGTGPVSPAPPATFSAALPDRHYRAARNRQQSTGIRLSVPPSVVLTVMSSQHDGQEAAACYGRTLRTWTADVRKPTCGSWPRSNCAARPRPAHWAGDRPAGCRWSRRR